jgi:hypothetical protein
MMGAMRKDHSLELRRYEEPGAFYRDAESFLLAHEAEHNLILGVCAGLIAHPERSRRSSWFATVRDDDTVIAVAFMTPPHNLALSRCEIPDALALIARVAQSSTVPPPGVIGPGLTSGRFARTWRELTGQQYRAGMAMRIYQLTTVIPVRGVPGTLRRATVGDRDFLVGWMAATIREVGTSGQSPEDAARIVDARLSDPENGLYLWCIDDTPVSMAGPSGPTPHGIRINAVYTPPALRRNGYASACVAALSQRLLNSGYQFCFLFTDLANPVSNRIYQAIGYQPVVDIDEYRFLPGGT